MAITKVIPAVIAVRPRGQRGLPGPPGAPGDQINFTTRLAAAAADLDPVVEFIRVSGYAVIGDGGGGGCWRRRSDQPAHSAFFQNAENGLYYEYCIERGAIFLPHLGGIGDDSTPCDDAFNTAMGLLFSTGGRGAIDFGPGTFKFMSRIDQTLTAGTGMLELKGSGPRVTELHFPNAGGIRIDRADYRGTVNLHDFSITTGKAGEGYAISLESAAYVSIPGSAWNNISNIVIGGDDWQSSYYLDHYWGTAVHIKVWGNFNLSNVNTVGNAHPSPGVSTGIFFEGDVVSENYGILYNVSQCSFTAHTYGFIYGDWIQGVTLNQCNFNGNSGGTAIFAGGGYTGVLAELCVSNCQFDFGGSCIALLSTVFDVHLTNNLFGATAANTQIIYMPGAFGFTIGNNKIYNWATNPGQTGIVIGAQGGAPGEGVITGNLFKGLGTGVFLGTGTTNVVVGVNTYINCTDKVVDLGATNSVGTHAVGAMTGVVP